MLYAILCYSSELTMSSWTRQQEDELLARRKVITDDLERRGRLAAVARLMPTITATTVRGGSQTAVLDGPFAETKEQLLGFYVVECATLEEAIEIGRGFAHDAGALEVRPVRSFKTGVLK